MPKTPVDHREVDREVLVARLGLGGVVPVVEARRREHGARAGRCARAGWRGSRSPGTTPRPGRPTSAARSKPSTKSGTNTTARVATASTRWSREPASQSIASLEWWTAWKRQSARHGVEGAVRGVAREVGHEQRLGELERERLRGHGLLEPRPRGAAEQQQRRRQGEERGHLDAAGGSRRSGRGRCASRAGRPAARAGARRRARAARTTTTSSSRSSTNQSRPRWLERGTGSVTSTPAPPASCAASARARPSVPSRRPRSARSASPPSSSAAARPVAIAVRTSGIG